MTKEQILALTGLDEDQFYQMYPDQESFCADFPDACAQIQQAKYGVQTENPPLEYGVNTQGQPGVLAYTAQVQPMQRDEYGNMRRPSSYNRQMTSAVTPMVPTFNQIRTVEKPGGHINPNFEGYNVSNKPTPDWQNKEGMWSRPGIPMQPYFDRSQKIDRLKSTIPLLSDNNQFNKAEPMDMSNMSMIQSNIQNSLPAANTSRYSSVVDMLKSKGQDSSFSGRQKLALEKGIKNYTGTAEQNMQLIDMLSSVKYGGGIHINPANKGKFTASANRAGMGVQEFARHVLANKEDYSSTQVKRANFARNASKWKHAEGGQLRQYQSGKEVVNFFPQLQQVIAEGPEPDDVNTLVEYLDYAGLDYSKPNRARMAKYMGVNNYDFSAKKNSELLNRIKKHPGVVDRIERFPLESDKSNVIVDQDGQVMMINKYGGQHNMYQNGGYVVKSGDNLSAIAARNNIPLSKIIALNPQYKSNPDLIRVGDSVNLGMTPMQRSNQEYNKIANDRLAQYREEAQIKRMQQYQVTAVDSKSAGSPSLKTNTKTLTSPSQIIKTENKKKSESLIKKNIQKNDVVITPSTPSSVNSEDIRDLESGVLVDKGTNTAYVLKNHTAVDSFPVLTGIAGKN
jgi:hypothetical protein